jgi:hypothetical protein
MEGKRFGVGLAAGLLVGLALVAVSGGLGATPLSYFGAQGRAAVTTAASSTSTMTVTSATSPIVTYTVATTTTSGWSSIPSQSSNGTAALSTSTTIIFSVSSTSTSTTNGPPSGESVVTNTNGGTPNGGFAPAANYNPTLVANIPRQAIVSNAEILAPILVAFLLGAFLYRVAVKEREGSDAEA